MCKENRFNTTLRLFFKIITIIQAAFAVVWIIGNIGGFQEDYFALNYCNSASSLIVDDYMGILYSLFVRVFGRHWALYIVQTGIVFYAGYLVSGSLWVASFVATNPCVLQSSFTVIPNSLLLSLTLMFVFLFTKRCRRSRHEKAFIAAGIALAMGLMAPDYAYLFIVASVVPFILSFFAKRFKKTRGLLFWIIVASFLCIGVNEKLATPNSYFRTEKTLEYAAFQRIVWPDVLRYNEMLRVYYGDLDAEMVAASKVPEKVAMDFGNGVIKNSDAEGLSYFYKYTTEETLTRGVRSNLYGIIMDAIRYGFAPFSSLTTYATKSEGTIIGMELSRFMYEAPVFSRLYFVFSLLSCVALSLVWPSRLVIGIFTKKKYFKDTVLALSIYLMIVVSIYQMLFATRGFSYRNALLMIVAWPLLSLLGQERNTDAV